ncbi:MAG: hypothetical protein JWM86_2835, partial [Thermoleophilia bacterium]|nr:hypothetical protein [Thermoleophilia bacterium]
MPTSVEHRRRPDLHGLQAEPRGPSSRVPHRGRTAARRIALVLMAAVVVVLLAPRATTWLLARGDVAHRPADLPRLAEGDRRAAIVLGAGLVGKRPSPLLEDRIDAAVGLLDAGRVDLLLMSGDNTTQYYDEPSAMRRRAIEDGAPAQLVAPDYAGRRTWDTCVRARQVFGIEQAVVVTSAFHIDRAIATCRAAGIDVTGYSVDESRHGVRNRAAWRTRELAATGR